MPIHTRVGMVCFSRQFEQERGEYTAVRQVLPAGVTMGDFEAYVEQGRKEDAK